MTSCVGLDAYFALDAFLEQFDSDSTVDHILDEMDNANSPELYKFRAWRFSISLEPLFPLLFPDILQKNTVPWSRDAIFLIHSRHYPIFNNIRQFICQLLVEKFFLIETMQSRVDTFFTGLIFYYDEPWAVNLLTSLCHSGWFILTYEIMKLTLRFIPNIAIDAVLPCLEHPLSLNTIFALCIFPCSDKEVHFALLRRLVSSSEYIMKFLENGMSIVARQALIEFVKKEYNFTPNVVTIFN